MALKNARLGAAAAGKHKSLRASFRTLGAAQAFIVGLTADYLETFTDENDLWRYPTWRVVSQVVKIQTGHKGCRFVDVAAPDARGKANVYCVHAWSGLWGQLVAACMDHQRSNPDKRMYFYIDALTINQHRPTGQHESKNEVQFMRDAIYQAGLGVVVVLDESTRALRRIWCLFEMYTAIKRSRKLFLKVGKLTTAKSLVDCSYSKVTDAIEVVEFATAVASVPADKEFMSKYFSNGRVDMVDVNQTIRDGLVLARPVLRSIDGGPTHRVPPASGYGAVAHRPGAVVLRIGMDIERAPGGPQASRDSSTSPRDRRRSSVGAPTPQRRRSSVGAPSPSPSPSPGLVRTASLGGVVTR